MMEEKTKVNEVDEFSKILGVNVDYIDAFFVNNENESVTWMYYNPDSVAGGQFVTNTITFNEIKEAKEKYNSSDDFFDFLGSIAYQTLADINTEWFDESKDAFLKTPDFKDCTEETMNELIKISSRR